MKLDNERYGVMLAAMRAVVQKYGGAAFVRKSYEDGGKSDMFMLWALWHNANHNLLYDDTHPGFVQGHWTRLYPYTPGFHLNDMKDTHIETALKKIGKELGLID